MSPTQNLCAASRSLGDIPRANGRGGGRGDGRLASGGHSADAGSIVACANMNTNINKNAAIKIRMSKVMVSAFRFNVNRNNKA